MKNLLLLISVLFAGTIAAQTLEAVDVNIQLPPNQLSYNGSSTVAKTTACGVDTIGYALAKATNLEALNINNTTSAGAGCQYYDAPQPITIHAVSFYAWKADGTNGPTMNAIVEIFAAGLDSVPTGLALATTTVVVDTVFGTGTLDELRKTGTFAVPVTVTGAYVIVVSNPTATPASMVFNSWTAADGDQEWLSSVQIGANWLRSYDVNIGGVTFDADCLFEPHVTYELDAGFMVDDPCFASGLTLNFTNTSSPITNNRMYNIAAFQSLTDLSYTWNYGDGTPVENSINAAHTYASASGYTVTLTDTLYGWTSNCSTDSMVIIGALPNAAFSSTQAGFSSSFTNSSTSGSGSSYLWDFGDGNTSVLTSPTHVYTAAGTYTVCLTTSDACGTDTTCASVTVSCAAPTPAFTFADAGQVVNFTNTSTAGGGATYLWILGDGNTSTQTSPTHTYSADGSYTVCLVVQDACGADSTCQTVIVTSCVNPISNFTIAGASPTYAFTSTATTTGSTTYTWDFGDGSSTSSLMNPSHTYTTNGTFIVSLMVVDSCGTHVLDQTVTVSGVGINELSLADVTVYPNPSNGIFTIEASAQMKSASITDLSGKLIYSGDLSGTKATISASQFANGTYFLSIRFEDGLNQIVRLEVVN